MIVRTSTGVALLTAALVAHGWGCAGPSQVTFVNNERPNAAGAPQGLAAGNAHQAPRVEPQQPQDDEEIVEPDRPAVDTKGERALVHIHAPDGTICSGVVLGPKIVATAQQCLKGEAKGASVIAANREYRIEIASSTLTWTVRRPRAAILPSCEVRQLDVGILVLAEPVAWIDPLRVVSAPSAGAKVEALGFGRCSADKATLKVARAASVQNRIAEALVIDVPLCRGDIGGPVIDGRAADIVGLISHRNDPDGSPLRTTTISRLDTTQARELLAQAKLVADGGDVSKVQPVVCH